MGARRDAGKTFSEAFLDELALQRAGWQKKPTVPLDELRARLEQIDWLRYRKHWIALTGAKMKDGKKRTLKLKSTGEDKVQSQAQNTQTVISSVRDKILSETWSDLTGKEDEPFDAAGPSPSRRRATSTRRAASASAVLSSSTT